MKIQKHKYRPTDEQEFKGQLANVKNNFKTLTTKMKYCEANNKIVQRLNWEIYRMMADYWEK